MGLIKWLEKNSDVCWIIVIGIAVIIFVLSSFSFNSPSGPPGTGLWSIVYHLLAFFFLNAFLLMAFVRGKRYEFILVAVFISITYGILDEVHQLFVPGRVSGVFDVMINNAGIFFSTIFYMESMRGRRGNFKNC